MQELLELLPHEAENLKRQQRNADEILKVAQALAKVEGINPSSPDVWLDAACPEHANSSLNSRGLRLALDAAIAIQGKVQA